MDKHRLLQTFTQEQRMNIDFPGFRREVDGPIIRQVSLGEEKGLVIFSALTEETADEAIRGQLDYFRNIGQAFEWKLYDYDQPVDLKERLIAHGFELEDREALMVMALDASNPLLSAEVPGSIRRITDVNHVNALIRMEEEVWGEPHSDLEERLKSELANDQEGIQIYAAYDGARVVSAAWMYLHDGTSFASFWGGSTLPKYRGKGIYTALIAVRAQEAWKHGYSLLTVDATPMSQPILERKGFSLLAYSYPCVSPPSE